LTRTPVFAVKLRLAKKTNREERHEVFAIRRKAVADGD
jgi:hypothetical protein